MGPRVSVLQPHLFCSTVCDLRCLSLSRTCWRAAPGRPTSSAPCACPPCSSGSLLAVQVCLDEDAEGQPVARDCPDERNWDQEQAGVECGEQIKLQPGIQVGLGCIAFLGLA